MALTDFLGRFGISGGFAYQFMQTFIWGLIIISVVTVIALLIRNKVKYQYWGFVLKRRQNDAATGEPTSNFISGKAGYFKKKSGKTVYRIKYGIMPWQQIETAILPDPKYMIGNLAVFIQHQKDNLTQAGISVDWEGHMHIEPISDEIKFGIQLEMNELDRILRVDKYNPTVVGMFILGIILVAGIVVFYFLNKGGPA